MDCFFWVPDQALSQLEVNYAQLQHELERGRLVLVPGFVPTMLAGLRLLVDATPLAFPEPRPNHWPPPGPKPHVRELLQRAHRASCAGAEHPFEALAAAAVENPDVAEEFAAALMDPVDADVEYWALWQVDPKLVAAAVAAPRVELVARWIGYPPAVWLRGSADLARERPSLEHVLGVLDRVSELPATHGIVLGWALEA